MHRPRSIEWDLIVYRTHSDSRCMEKRQYFKRQIQLITLIYGTNYKFNL